MEWGDFRLRNNHLIAFLLYLSNLSLVVLFMRVHRCACLALFVVHLWRIARIRNHFMLPADIEDAPILLFVKSRFLLLKAKTFSLSLMM